MALTAQELSQYLADAPPSVVRLEITKHFDALSDSQKRYAHYISRYVVDLLSTYTVHHSPCHVR